MSLNNLRQQRIRRFAPSSFPSPSFAAPSPSHNDLNDDTISLSADSDDLSVENIFASSDCTVPIPPLNPTTTSSSSSSPQPSNPLSNPASTSSDPDAPPFCRICFDDTPPFISPCRCTGTQRYVHLECLNRWRLTTANPAALSACQTCGLKYHIVRSKVRSIKKPARRFACR